MGNFSNRILKFLAGSLKKVVPAYPEGEKDKVDTAFVDKIFAKFAKYIELMEGKLKDGLRTEGCKLKDGLRTAMEVSSDCNTYI